ncbi:orotidine-5'-phosphate decarboxylase [Alteribacillus persepolensis]|uniref:Orotidine 5'-phosphate decarboxylase n=1 Tax=Alteribacillus persepolensis TaxID=568899 RepID=A0A1G7YHD6_9BACI|nr:orotidine-5'-phosphate decarboxylase [Alteribacillus persepolensis]SDG95992.1 orotidine-5'-phosphate decarboxylase [Alteribacillus persepolensis]
MNKPLIIAMDFADKQTADAFLGRFENEKLFLKIGMELFYREGPALVNQWKSEGHDIFLDLKLHDIPNTVKQAAKQLASLEADLITVHAGGGINMMEAAKEGLEAGQPVGSSTKCIAVTQLTSTSKRMLKEELLIEKPLEDTVAEYAGNTDKAGLDGVVCSALEVPLIKEHVRTGFQTVTPGIRQPEHAADDQERIVTPEKAKELGSDAIVVGRSITRADDAVSAYQQINKAWRNET